MSPFSKSSWVTCEAKASADCDKQVYQYVRKDRTPTRHSKDSSYQLGPSYINRLLSTYRPLEACHHERELCPT